MMIRVVLAFAVAALGVTAVLAQGDPIAARQKLMKENSAQGRIAREMIEGKRPFDLAAAKKVLATYQDAAVKAKDLFPANSKTGGDTEALPAIWEKKAEFEAKLAKFGSDAKAAAANVTDLASFKAEMAVVGKNCGGCHNEFRKKKT